MRRRHAVKRGEIKEDTAPPRQRRGIQRPGAESAARGVIASDRQDGPAAIELFSECGNRLVDAFDARLLKLMVLPSTATILAVASGLAFARGSWRLSITTEASQFFGVQAV